MKNYKYYSRKNKGYVMIFVMILLSGIIFLIVSISTKIYVSRQLARTYERQHALRKLFANALGVIRGLISEENSKNENKEKANEENNQEKKDNGLDLFKILWNNIYQWKKYSFTEENDGVDGKVSLYLMVEDGKIPFTAILRKLQEKTKKKEGEKEGGGEADLQKEKEEEDGNSDQEKSFENDDSYKRILEWYNALSEKSSACKSIAKKIEQKTGKQQTMFMNTLMKHWMKKKSLFRPASVWDMIQPLEKSLESFSAPYVLDGEEKKYEIGDVFSVYPQTWSSLYIAPGVIEATGIKDFQFTDEMRKSILEAGEKIIKSGNNQQGPEAVWDALYTKATKAPFPKNIAQDMTIKGLLLPSPYPEYISALIIAEVQNVTMKFWVLFEKLTSFDKANNNQYAIKQIFMI